MIQMLIKLLRGTDWELLTGFASPAFFEVVPSLGMTRVFMRIAKDYASSSDFDRAFKKAKKALPKIPRGMGNDPAVQGRAVLELFFKQIFDFDSAVMDLRSSAFQFNADKVVWNPKPLFYVWDPEFVLALRKMYRGFYRNDEVEYMAGLEALDLSHAKAAFKSHFGEGDQSSVRFTLASFKKSFHSVFESCKKNGTRLHPDFFALGAYLLCLYEHLEGLDVPIDVRGAFYAVVD